MGGEGSGRREGARGYRRERGGEEEGEMGGGGEEGGGGGRRGEGRGVGGRGGGEEGGGVGKIGEMCRVPEGSFSLRKGDG